MLATRSTQPSTGGFDGQTTHKQDGRGIDINTPQRFCARISEGSDVTCAQNVVLTQYGSTCQSNGQCGTHSKVEFLGLHTAIGANSHLHFVISGELMSRGGLLRCRPQQLQSFAVTCRLLLAVGDDFRGGVSNCRVGAGRCWPTDMKDTSQGHITAH